MIRRAARRVRDFFRTMTGQIFVLLTLGIAMAAILSVTDIHCGYDNVPVIFGIVTPMASSDSPSTHCGSASPSTSTSPEVGRSPSGDVVAGPPAEMVILPVSPLPPMTTTATAITIVTTTAASATSHGVRLRSGSPGGGGVGASYDIAAA